MSTKNILTIIAYIVTTIILTYYVLVFIPKLDEKRMEHYKDCVQLTNGQVSCPREEIKNDRNCPLVEDFYGEFDKYAIDNWLYENLKDNS